MQVANLMTIAETVAKLGNVAGRSLQDGKISFGDIVYLPDIASVFVNLIKTDWALVLPEFHGMSDEQQAKVLQKFKDTLNIPEKDVEAQVEVIIDSISLFAKSMSSIVAILKK